MDRFCLGVVAGALLALWLPALPASLYLLPLTLLLALAGRRFAACCGICCYLLLLNWQHQQFVRQHQQLAAQNTIEVCVKVVSLVRHFTQSAQFVAELQPSCQGQVQQQAGARLAISWYDERQANQPRKGTRPVGVGSSKMPAPDRLHSPQATPAQLAGGQLWQMRLRLRSLYGSDNPGAAERARLSMVAGHHARASVVQALLLTDRRDWRQHLVEQLQHCCGHYQSLPLWLALTLGERPFSDELWLGVQASGLAHLLSISGMHISLLFGMLMLLGQIVQRFSKAPPVLLLGCAVMALGLAWGYALLAGLAVPTLRAVMSLTLVLLLQQRLRRYSPWQLGWLLAALLLLIWPYLLFSYSYWLSVLALALLALLTWLYPPQTGWRAAIWQFLRFQLAFSFLLQPLTLLLFGGVAPYAFFINIVVVPLITLLVMPVLALMFAALLLTGTVALWMATLLELLLAPLYQLLHAMAAPAYWLAWPDLPLPVVIVLAVGCCWCWLPVGRWRLLCLPTLLPLLVVLRAPAMPQLFVLDVGQGSSAVLQQGKQALVIDLGPAQGDWSATRQIVLPFLRSRGVRQLNAVIISHDDADHSGHWPLLLQHYPATPLVSDIRRLAPRYHCGRQWLFGDVAVQTFRAGPYQPEPDNESSCVVLLRYRDSQVLLPGDIGRREPAMVDWSGPVDILLLGHHGSRSSSSLATLRRLQPRLALASAGLENRFNHPAVQTQARLQLLQIPLLRTDHNGAIQLSWQQGSWQIRTSRASRFAPWVEKSLFKAESVGLNR